MRDRARLWAVLALTYVAGSQIVHLLWTNRFDTSAVMLAHVVAVPAAQVAALALVARLHGARLAEYGQRLGLGGFFAAWLVSALALGATTLAVDFLLFSLLDLTASGVTVLLFVPVTQAAAVSVATTRDGHGLRWRGVARHPLAAPVLMLDALMLPAGWLWPSDPLLGLAEAAVMQRRWMGTKFVVAAVVLAVAAARLRPRGSPMSVPLVLTAALLAAVGLNGFVAWMFASAAWAPAPLSSQPATLIWLEGYGAFAALFLWSSLAAARRLDSSSAAAADLVRAGSVAIFLALLAVLMNGFLSRLPVQPWAGLALTLASLAGTLYAIAALVIDPPPIAAHRI